MAEFSYDWRRALVKEYGTVCFSLVSLLVLLSWKIGWVCGYEADKATIYILCVGCVPVLVCYGIVRYLKITRRLRPARREETEEAI